MMGDDDAERSESSYTCGNVNKELDKNGDMTTSEDPVYFTTHDLIKTINGILRENEAAFNEESGGDVINSSSSLSSLSPSPSSSLSECGGGFELQRRLPDGTTRRADESDMALANFQSKLKQTAEKISKLSPLEKISWAKEQRQYGNKLYSKQLYKEAMDIYLTCLVAIDFKNGDKGKGWRAESITSDTVDDRGGDDQDDDREEWSKRIDNEIKLPVLLNLSACTLKLGMYRKTCSFCDMALEMEKPGSGMSMYSKVYFRRGKSRMLMGLYTHARADFHKCLSLLGESDEESNKNKGNNNGIDAVRREMITLQRLARNARKNRAQQEKAMKLLLGGGSSSEGGDEDDHCRETTSFRAKPNPNESGKVCRNGNKEAKRLYADIHTPSSSIKVKTREYSTLRAKPRKRAYIEREMPVETMSTSSAAIYFLWYLQMIESGLRKIVYWLGNENIDDKEGDEIVSHSLHSTKSKQL